MADNQEQTLNYDEILAALRAKREQLEEAILVIERLNASEGRGPGRPPREFAVPAISSGPVESSPTRKKRSLSAQGRKRIAEASKKRWAGVRAAKKAALKKASKATPKPRKRMPQAKATAAKKEE